MGLNELSFEVKTDQLAVFSDIDLLADIAGGYRIKSIAETDMVIGVDLAKPPLGGIKPFASEWEKRSLFFLFKNDPGTLAGGSMDAQAGRVSGTTGSPPAGHVPDPGSFRL